MRMSLGAQVFNANLGLMIRMEAEDSRVVAVMGCYGMSIQDGLRYAREARICVGFEQAYQAAAEGHPFLLPWRGPPI
jgi:hypothetical protein